MQRRGRPPTRRVAARAPAPAEEHVNESVNVLTPPTPSSPPHPNVSIERARKLGAKPYDGTSDPEHALSWLDSNEEIFQVMGCTEEQKVTYSTFLLKDRAKDWWKALQRRHPEGGNMSVADYERRFLELIRAVLYIADNEEEKANRLSQPVPISQRPDPQLQGRPVGAEANREVVSSLEGLAVQVSPAEELVGVDHPGDSLRGPVLRPEYL
ncbi:hypothetical protein JRO89_XS03G0133800 [Xanthoceras sorbifolium]|uniref:Retrotransposon gag domain-containing protein n=1 Tax=Xanthoceras sorbifolium TaxID=99658 RepID=A0ABQ8I9R8_9ROSI|nr:hypothetical protein JRO89_XS03G0133800 [Xanthoceras sorbifolium]